MLGITGEEDATKVQSEVKSEVEPQKAKKEPQKKKRKKSFNRRFPLKNVHDPATGNTLLMFAVIDNRINLMERIVNLGCEINARNHVSPSENRARGSFPKRWGINFTRPFFSNCISENPPDL